MNLPYPPAYCAPARCADDISTEAEMWRRLCHLEMLWSMWGRHTHPNPGQTAPGSGSGQSNYQLWLEAGNTGTVQDYLLSLIGKDNYQLWLDDGNTGSLYDFLETYRGPRGNDGDSAFAIWQRQNPGGTVTQFFASLVGEPGRPGLSTYDIWLSLGNKGSMADFILAQKGRPGEDGKGSSGEAYAVYLSKLLTGGETDHTAAFITAIGQLTLRYNRLVITKGHYYVDTGKIALLPNITLDFEAGAIVESRQAGNMFDGQRCPNVTVNGGLFIGPDNKTKAFVFDDESHNPSMSHCEAKGCTLARVSASSGFVNLMCLLSCPSQGLEFFGAAGIDLYYADNFRILYTKLNGYSHGFQYWGGDSNPTIGKNSDGSDKKEPVRLRDTNGLRIPRGIKNGRIIGCEVRDVLGGGIWGSMGDDILAINCTVERCGDVGIDFEGSVNCKAIDCTVRDCVHGGLATFYACDNIEWRNCTSIVSSNAYKPLGIYGLSRPCLSGRIVMDTVTFRCDAGWVEAGYEDTSYQDLVIRNCRWENVSARFHNNIGWKQTFEGGTFKNTSASDYSPLQCGALNDFNGQPPEIRIKGTEFVNQKALDEKRVGAFGYLLYPVVSASDKAVVTLERVKTKGFGLDAVIKSPVGAVLPVHFTELVIVNCTWGSRNLYIEPEIEAARVNFVISQQANTSGDGTKPYGPGMQSVTELTTDTRGASFGDTLYVYDDNKLRAGQVHPDTGKLIPIREYIDVSVNLENESWFYLTTLAGEQIPSNRQVLGISLRASRFLHADQDFQHDIRLGSRNALTVQQQVYGMDLLADRIASLEIYDISGNADTDFLDQAYRVYLRVQPGFHAVRLHVDEMVQYTPEFNWLAKSTSQPAGQKVRDTMTNLPQLWVSRTGNMTSPSAGDGSGGTGGGDLSNYYNKSETNALVAGRANTDLRATTTAAQAVAVPGLTFFQITGDTENLYYKLPGSTKLYRVVFEEQ